MTVLSKNPYLNFFEEHIPNYCDEAPAPVSAERPYDIAVLLFKKVNTLTRFLRGTYMKKVIPRLACPTRCITWPD
jgi:hypothetical protein